MNNQTASINYASGISLSNDAAEGEPLPSVKTISGIFFQPGVVFESLRKRPVFLLAALIILAFITLFNVTYISKIGYEELMRAQIEITPQMAKATAEQKEQFVEIISSTSQKVIRYISPAITATLMFVLGAGLYWVCSIFLLNQMSYKQSLSVWIYSSLPPTVLLVIGNIIMLFISPPEGSDVVMSLKKGLLKTNPGFLIDGETYPVLVTALGAFDIFVLYGLFLAILGLRKVGNLSTTAATGIAGSIWFIGVLGRTVISYFVGMPLA
jgi:hypothetical protein